jgi:hypothetical protein
VTVVVLLVAGEGRRREEGRREGDEREERTENLRILCQKQGMGKTKGGLHDITGLDTFQGGEEGEGRREERGERREGRKHVPRIRASLVKNKAWARPKEACTISLTWIPSKEEGGGNTRLLSSVW